jgi:primary-amine oxidase
VPRHPLDELTAAEVRSTVDVLRAAGLVHPQLRFSAIELHEPEKAVVAAAARTGAYPRSADVIAFDWARAQGYRGVVDLRRHRVAGWDTLPPHRRPMLGLVIRRLEEAVAGDPRWLRALRRHGMSDPAAVAVFGVPSAATDTVRCAPAHQCLEATVNVRAGAPPADEIPGLSVRVDLTDARLLAVDDTGPAALPPVDELSLRALHRAPGTARGETAPAVRDTAIHVRGSEIRWGPWRLHAGVHPRRGLELWDVALAEEGRWRSVLYRAALVDMVAPYGDPRFGSFAPNDEKAFGLLAYGRNSVIEDGDVPSGARFADAVVPDDAGRPLVVPRAMAIHEITDGVAWRHAGDARLARRLVLTSVATVDNYDYAFSWILSQDGTIDADIRLTGVLNLGRSELERDTMTAGPERADHSHLVGAHVYAPHHQHFFSYRLDFDIDAAAGNRVIEMNTEPDPVGPGNERGEWFTLRSRVLATELAARRDPSLASSRRWRVENVHVRNALGQPVGYTLLPGDNAVSFSAPESPVRQAEPYLGAALWVTPEAAGEMYPAGTGPRVGRPTDDLAAWTRGDRRVDDTDVVLWYTLGVTHVPRPEDFPFMAAYRTGFRLVPTGFFSRNPVLDARKPARVLTRRREHTTPRIGRSGVRSSPVAPSR